MNFTWKCNGIIDYASTNASLLLCVKLEIAPGNCLKNTIMVPRGVHSTADTLMWVIVVYMEILNNHHFIVVFIRVTYWYLLQN